MSCNNNSVPLVGTKLTCNTWLASRSFARKAGIEPTLTVLETALLPLEDFRKIARGSTPHIDGFGDRSPTIGGLP